MSNKQFEMMAAQNGLYTVDQETAEKIAEAVTEGAVDGYQKIEDTVVTGYKKIEDGVVGGYKKIENGAVTGFGKVVDKCVEVLFARDGETVEEAKARLNSNVKGRE